MTWSKIDDQAHAHPKVREAWQADGRSLGLQFLALSYAGAYNTDGRIPTGFVTEKLPDRRDRERITAVLVGAGIWDLHEDGFVIHDYLDFNPSRAEILEQRAATEAKRAVDRARKANGNRGDS